MSFLASIRVALGALLIHKGRSALTSLGIIIGIGAAIALVSAGSGARLKLDEQLSNVGKDVILIRAGARNQQGMVTDFVPLTREDAAALRKEAGPLLRGVAESQMTTRPAANGSVTHLTSIIGSVPDLQRVRNWTVAAGRFSTNEEVKGAANVCLIGQTVREKLFPDTPDPVGRTIRVDRLRLRIIGCLVAKGHDPRGADQDDQVIVPITTLQQKIVGEERIGLIVAAARSTDVLDQAKEKLIAILRRQHHLRPGEPNNFDVSTVREMSALAETLASTMQMLVGIIASISLVVGGVGIMNIMLASVTERTREIGIRMAVGATPAAILFQFLAEAVSLALIGGLLGIVLGVVSAALLARLADWPAVVSLGAVLLGTVVSVGIGVFFGLYPAWKAARLDPIEALHYE
jgi:putative ABC transport system permease protein